MIVRLIDGREVDSWSEDWRAECEARTVCQLPTRGTRAQYLVRVEAKRGKPAADALRELVLQVWNAEFQRGG